MKFFVAYVLSVLYVFSTMNNLTVTDVVNACGNNEQRILDVARRLTLPVRTNDTWYTVAYNIATELNTSAVLLTPAEKLEMVVGLVG